MTEEEFVRLALNWLQTPDGRTLTEWDARALYATIVANNDPQTLGNWGSNEWFREARFRWQQTDEYAEYGREMARREEAGTSLNEEGIEVNAEGQPLWEKTWTDKGLSPPPQPDDLEAGLTNLPGQQAWDALLNSFSATARDRESQINARVESMQNNPEFYGWTYEEVREEAEKEYDADQGVWTPILDRDRYRVVEMSDAALEQWIKKNPDHFYDELWKERQAQGVGGPFDRMIPKDVDQFRNYLSDPAKASRLMRYYIAKHNQERQQEGVDYKDRLLAGIAMVAAGQWESEEAFRHMGLPDEQRAGWISDFYGYQQNQELDWTSHEMPIEAFMDARLPWDAMNIWEGQVALSQADEDTLIQAQTLMMNAGYYEAAPTFGNYNPKVDGRAVATMMADVQSQPHLHPLDVVMKAVDRELENVLRQELDLDNPFSDRNGDGIPDQVYSVTSHETLGRLADASAQRFTGRDLDPGVKAELVAQAMAAEQNNLRALHGSFVRGRLASGGGVEDVDLFIQATGGLRAVPDQAWRRWSKLAGLETGAPQTDENKRRVERKLASMWFSKFGNWYDTAIQWRNGPGATNILPDHLDRTRDFGQRDYGAYTIRTMQDLQDRRMAEFQAENEMNFMAGEDGMYFVEDFDAAAHMESLVRANRRTAEQNWAYFDRSIEFTDMLRSTI